MNSTFMPNNSHVLYWTRRGHRT